MKYANQISEIINAFSPEPLKIEQMERFYCGDTMEYRTGDKYSSPIEDIFDACREQEGDYAFLLLGHRGCGKSTELNRMCEKLEEKGYQVKTVMCSMDLDKLNPDDAWKVFYNYAAILSGMPFPVIYTFPIGLSYDPRFAALEGYFVTKTLPMIKIETIDGQRYPEGIDVIQEIIGKRADRSLFEDGVLERLIQYTGGSLRDLFHAINSAAKRAERRGGSTVSMEDAERALEELKTSLTRRIEKKDYEFLLNICNGSRELIEDKEMLLKMLQASVVLEYNGKRWHSVHPLITRFFREQGLIENVGE